MRVLHLHVNLDKFVRGQSYMKYLVAEDEQIHQKR